MALVTELYTVSEMFTFLFFFVVFLFYLILYVSVYSMSPEGFLFFKLL